MPENFKKYNIDGVPKRRKSENNHNKDNDPEADAALATKGLGEKTLSKRRLQDNLSIQVPKSNFQTSLTVNTGNDRSSIKSLPKFSETDKKSK